MSTDHSTSTPSPASPPSAPEHRPKARASRVTMLLITISILGAIGFVVAYFAVPGGHSVADVRAQNLYLGGAAFFALAGLGVAIVNWAKTGMNSAPATEERHPLASDPETVTRAEEVLESGVDDLGMGRRPFLKGALVVAAGLVPVAAALPLVTNLSKSWDVSAMKHTIWDTGVRLAKDPSGIAIRASEVTIGSVFHVIPETLKDSPHPMEDKAKAIVLLVRLDPRDLKEAPSHEGFSYDGIVAYSKVCTHVGCPVALYEQQTHHLLCPCHQSTFDISDGAKVVFGPAKRALPQLPITVDTSGYLVAQSDFLEPVGPSFWEREK